MVMMLIYSKHAKLAYQTNSWEQQTTTSIALTYSLPSPPAPNNPRLGFSTPTHTAFQYLPILPNPLPTPRCCHLTTPIVYALAPSDPSILGPDLGCDFRQTHAPQTVHLPCPSFSVVNNYSIDYGLPSCSYSTLTLRPCLSTTTMLHNTHLTYTASDSLLPACTPSHSSQPTIHAHPLPRPPPYSSPPLTAASLPRAVPQPPPPALSTTRSVSLRSYHETAQSAVESNLAIVIHDARGSSEPPPTAITPAQH
jgi:hypothetical protein